MVDSWGSHNRPSLLPSAQFYSFDNIFMQSAFFFVPERNTHFPIFQITLFPAKNYLFGAQKGGAAPNLPTYVFWRGGGPPPPTFP